MMRRRTFATTILVACIAGALPAVAQDYPARDIRVLCNFTPGSSADVFVRFYAERLSAMTSQNVKVENRTKNGGLEATEAAAKAKPDGYTILITPANATLAAAWHTARKPKWDPLRDFAPVTTIARFAHVVLVNPRTPIKSIAELTAYAKSRKDDATFGANAESAGAAALYNKLAGIDSSRIATTASAALINDLYAGDADYLVLDIPAVYDQMKAGKLRPLAVSTAKRSSLLPDVPTMEEAGVKGYGNVERWWAVFAPAKTPQPILEKLEATFTRILESEESKKFIANVRAEPFPGDAQSTQTLLASEVKRWGELVKLAE
jgi:tripartite-type tricarboxylate transporter receptor subunit TctC